MMKSLLYRNCGKEFVLKYEDDDLHGLLQISVDDDEITPAQRDDIIKHIDEQHNIVSINGTIIFEVTDHDAPQNNDEDENWLGLPDSFET